MNLLVDQSLGQKAVPAFFREAGFDTTTIQELFGDTKVRHEVWIRKAGELNMVVAHKDARILAVRRGGVQELSLT